MRQYALPRTFASTIFVTEGHRAAGTIEKLTPRMAMRVTASHLLGKAGRRKAKLRWQTIMITAPPISIVAPLPLKSRKPARMGVRIMARMGKKLNSCAADAASIPRVVSRKLGA